MTEEDQLKFNEYMNSHIDEINDDLIKRAKRYGLKVNNDK